MRLMIHECGVGTVTTSQLGSQDYYRPSSSRSRSRSRGIYFSCALVCAGIHIVVNDWGVLACRILVHGTAISLQFFLKYIGSWYLTTVAEFYAFYAFYAWWIYSAIGGPELVQRLATSLKHGLVVHIPSGCVAKINIP
jgi:hypothetical protein